MAWQRFDNRKQLLANFVARTPPDTKREAHVDWFANANRCTATREVRIRRFERTDPAVCKLQVRDDAEPRQGEPTACAHIGARVLGLTNTATAIEPAATCFDVILKVKPWARFIDYALFRDKKTK